MTQATLESEHILKGNCKKLITFLLLVKKKMLCYFYSVGIVFPQIKQFASLGEMSNMDYNRASHWIPCAQENTGQGTVLGTE